VAFLSVAPIYGQNFEAAAVAGGAFGGTIKLEQPFTSNLHAHVADTFVYGFAAGFRFDGEDCQQCSTIDFRWTRQDTHFSAEPTPFTPALRPSLAIGRYLVDFTHEFAVEDYPIVKPFLTFTMGLARLATPQSTFVRGVFGLGTGVKIFPSHKYGVRVQAEYLPIVLSAGVQNVICGGGGCLVALGGGIVNQFQVSAGPEFHF
jgi:hypothetical protein